MSEDKSSGLKRGKLSLIELDTIKENVSNKSIAQIAAIINRSIEFVEKVCREHKLTYKEMSEEVFDDTVLAAKLEERPYWFEVKEQFSDAELQYFIVTWIRMMKQFKEDILYSEELQVKQWITLEIMANRVLKERKASIEQIDRMQSSLNNEYNKDLELRDMQVITGLETELSLLRNSLGSYTNEHVKILEQTQKIQTQLITVLHTVATESLKSEVKDELEKSDPSSDSAQEKIRANSTRIKDINTDKRTE